MESMCTDPDIVAANIKVCKKHVMHASADNVVMLN